MKIKFNNCTDLLKQYKISTVTYDQRFMMYVGNYPEMGTLKGLRDCENLQIFDALNRGYQLEDTIDAMKVQWLKEEENQEHSQELSNFLWIVG